MIQVDVLLQAQQQQVTDWHRQSPTNSFDLESWSSLVAAQNWANYQLWHQEDLARDPEASDSVIAEVKRKIDKLNQQRNDLIEQLDEHLIEHLREVEASEAPLNSETPGSIIDRLSINALKIYHMNEELERSDATQAHREKCYSKLLILREQRSDLAECLRTLEKDLLQGNKRLKVYRQMKMYNDPTLNPVLYSKA